MNWIEEQIRKDADEKSNREKQKDIDDAKRKRDDEIFRSKFHKIIGCFEKEFRQVIVEANKELDKVNERAYIHFENGYVVIHSKEKSENYVSGRIVSPMFCAYKDKVKLSYMKEPEFFSGTIGSHFLIHLEKDIVSDDKNVDGADPTLYYYVISPYAAVGCEITKIDSCPINIKSLNKENIITMIGIINKNLSLGPLRLPVHFKNLVNPDLIIQRRKRFKKQRFVSWTEDNPVTCLLILVGLIFIFIKLIF